MKYKYSYLLQSPEGVKYFMETHPPAPESFFILPYSHAVNGLFDTGNYFGVYGSVIGGKVRFVSDFVYPIVVFLGSKFPEKFANQFIVMDSSGWDVLMRNSLNYPMGIDLNLIPRFNKQAGIPSPDKFYTQATYHTYMNLRTVFIIDGVISHNSPPKNLPILYKNKKYFLSSNILQYLIGSIHNGMNIHSLEIPLSTWSEYFVNHHYLKVNTDIVEKILWYLDKKLSSEKINCIFESLIFGE